jgi:hypothetical protein
MPLETENSYSIRLYLESPGNVKAEFSGEPIRAIIETSDSMMFSSLNWRTGNGLYKTDDTTLTKKSRKFNAYLSWNAYPRYKDSIDKAFYDTVYVGIGGNIKKSNIVIIKVSNLPVLIDSLKVSTRTFKQTENPWRFNVHDSISKLHIKVFSRDLDGKTPDMTISGNEFTIERYPADPFHVSYWCPIGPFVDTLIFTLFDHAQGQAVRSLFLDRIYQNVPPVIDSFTINSKIYKNSDRKVYAIFENSDTIKINIFCHDIYDSISLLKWNLKNNKLIVDSLNKKSVTFVCTTSTCNIIPTKKVIYLDTLKVSVLDTRNDSANVAIYIGKGIVNKPPVIKSISIDSSLINDTNTAISYVKSVGNIRRNISISVYDPDSNKITYAWRVLNGKLGNDTGSSVSYTTPNQIIKDTITVTAADDDYITKSVIVINVDDIYPAIDSLIVNKKVYKNIEDTIWYNASYNEQVTILSWARDFDKIDSLKYTWKVRDPAMIISMADAKLVLKIPQNKIIDTVLLSIIDGAYAKKLQFFINVNQPEPVIDSIKLRTIVYNDLTKNVLDSAVFPDTLGIIIYSHDLQDDTVTVGCEAILKSRISKVTPVLFRYLTFDSTYTDTLSISVKDTKNNTSRKKVILNVKEKSN